MKYLLLFLSLLLAGAAHAQSPLATVQPTPLVSPAPAPDTVAALHRLFASQRKRRNILAAGLGTGFLVGMTGAIATEGTPANQRNILDLDSPPAGSSTASSPSQAPNASAGWALGAAVAAPLLALDYVVHARYTHKREKQAVADYQLGKLSPQIKKKLRAKYFRPSK